MARAKDANGLTVKQEAFARAYVETGNAREAYRRAYDVKKMGDVALGVEAHRTLHLPNVALMIQRLQQSNAQQHEITIERLTQMLLADRELARQNNDAGNAVKAVDALGKLHGLIVEKKHVVSDNRHHHTAEPVSESAAWVAGLIGTGTDSETSEPLPN